MRDSKDGVSLHQGGESDRAVAAGRIDHNSVALRGSPRAAGRWALGPRSGGAGLPGGTFRANARVRARAIGLSVVLSLVMTGVVVRPLRAQAEAEPAAGQPEFSATWVPVESNVQQIDVGVNRSTRVQFSKPIVRAYSAEEDRVSVRVISPVELLVTGRAPGTTQVMVWAEDDSQLVFDVNVEINIDRLRDAIRRAAPTSKITVDAVLGTIVLTGIVRDPDTAARVEQLANLFGPEGVQNHLEVAGEHQVLLRVTVAEMSRQATRQLGINGFLAGDDFQDVFVLNNIAGINPSNIGAAPGAPATGTIPFFVGGGGIPVGQATTLSLGFPRVQMQLFLQALRENGLARILAEPTLTTLSGQPASFLAGGEFPIPVPQGGIGGANTITIDFKEFGVRLGFLPTVLGNNRIRMTVTPEVSELDFTAAVNIQAFAVPGLTSRSATTTVEVANGQTIVLAGLLDDQVRANSTKIPGLAEVPILGALFRSVRYQRNHSELVIMATPEIVAPMNPDQVPPVPGESHLDPNDWELFGLGVLERGASPLDSGLAPPGPSTAMEPEPIDVEDNPDMYDMPVDPAPSKMVPAGPEPLEFETVPMAPEPDNAVEPPPDQPRQADGALYGPWGPASLAEEETTELP